MLGASVTPKLAGMQVADDTMRQLGWPDGFVLMIGIIELVCVLLYVFPKTSVLGAVLTMGLLGGAMATQIRAGSPLFSHQLFQHLSRACSCGAGCGCATRRCGRCFRGRPRLSRQMRRCNQTSVALPLIRPVATFSANGEKN